MNFGSFKSITKCLLITFFCALTAFAQTTAFNFQGRLNDGASPANGNYDLQFKLFDAIAGGNQVGATVDRPNLQLINGVFSTTLDFGAAFSGSRFLEIAVRPAGSSNAHVVLGARQQILAVPFAVQATNSVNATNATNAQNAVNATNAANAVNATNAATSQNSLSLGGVTASNYARLDTINPGQLVMDGNVRQSINSNGLVKAMIYVNSNGTIARCYNSVTGQSTGNCGFTVTQTSATAPYNINFGFPVSNRFVSVTAGNADAGSLDNYGANFRFNGGNLEVFIFLTNNQNDTTFRDFMAIVY